MTKEEILQKATIAALPQAMRECAGKDPHLIAARAREVGQATADVLPMTEASPTRPAKQSLGKPRKR